MGKVFLIGAGPGDPELLTVRALRLLHQATVVLHDSLVSREVLNEIAVGAEIVDVGKRCGQKLLTQDEINSLLISHASSHGRVLRLKGGDPLIFGRAGEEMEALRRANVEFEIVPGVTAALGAAAAAGVSLTDRRTASQVLIATFSRGADATSINWAALTADTTLVLYMPGADYAEVSDRLLDAGVLSAMPCVIVSSATTPRQQIRWTSVGVLATEERLPAPALLIVGRTAAQTLQQLNSGSYAPRSATESVNRSTTQLPAIHNAKSISAN
jgi:uroporphyrin-III C-methyltransferase